MPRLSRVSKAPCRSKKQDTDYTHRAHRGKTLPKGADRSGLADKALYALHRDFDLIEGGRKAATQVAFAAGAKGAARDARDFLLFEEFDSEVFRGKARGLD